MENSMEGIITWNPRCKKDSVNMARLFIRKMYLSVITDMVDTYLKNVVIDNRFLFSDSFVNELNGCRGIRDRVIFFKDKFFDISPFLFSMMDLIISWRNKATHSTAPDTFSKSSREILIFNHQYVAERYSNTDIVRLIEDYEKSGDITHKELLCLNTSALEFINEVDKEILSQFNKDAFFSFFEKEVNKMEKAKLNNLKNQDNTRALNFVAGMLHNLGFSESTKKIYTIEDCRSCYKTIDPITIDTNDLLKFFV